MEIKPTTTSGKKPSSTTSLKSSGSRQPDRATVERRAWEIWKEKGSPQGCEMENWLQAERELKKS